MDDDSNSEDVNDVAWDNEFALELLAEAFGEENLSPELLAQMEDISDESEDEIDNEIGEDLFADFHQPLVFQIGDLVYAQYLDRPPAKGKIIGGQNDSWTIGLLNSEKLLDVRNKQLVFLFPKETQLETQYRQYYSEYGHERTIEILDKTFRNKIMECTNLDINATQRVVSFLPLFTMTGIWNVQNTFEGYWQNLQSAYEILFIEREDGKIYGQNVPESGIHSWYGIILGQLSPFYDLIFLQRNLDDHESFVECTCHWEIDKFMGTWRGAKNFGRGDFRLTRNFNDLYFKLHDYGNEIEKIFIENNNISIESEINKEVLDAEDVKIISSNSMKLDP